MYADGIIGNKGMLQVMGSLTTAIFNYIRSQHTTPYDLKAILGQSYGYIFNDVEMSASDGLLLFLTQAQGFNPENFKRK